MLGKVKRVRGTNTFCPTNFLFIICKVQLTGEGKNAVMISDREDADVHDGELLLSGRENCPHSFIC